MVVRRILICVLSPLWIIAWVIEMIISGVCLQQAFREWHDELWYHWYRRS